MPIRIYALAKDLKIDSKDLVDICTKAGVPGKGSALASLEDDEVAKVKAFLANGPKKPGAKSEGAASAKAVEAAPLSREDYIPVNVGPAKIKVLDNRTAKKPAVEVAAKGSTSVAAPEPPTPEISLPPVPESSVVPVAEQPEPEGVEVSAKVEPPPPPVAPAATPKAPLAPQKPAYDPLAPVRAAPVVSRPPVLRLPSSPKGSTGAAAPSGAGTIPPRKREPVIKLATMPEVKQPVPGTPTKEVKAQKPEIRLPKDVIRKAQAGARPPLADLVPQPAPDKSRGKAGAGAGRGPGVAAPSADSPLGKAAGRRGKPGKPGEGEADLAGMASARADRQKARKTRTGPGEREEGDDESLMARRARRLIRRGTGVNTAAPRKEKVALELPCTLRAFSEAAGVGTGQILKTLMQMGQMVNINATVTQEMAEMLSLELGLELELKAKTSLEDAVVSRLKEEADDPAFLKPRPPVVTFLGHVDHGKTSLLDRIIGIDVVSKEAGGITQHIRAYQINKGDRKISFVDTPGHEAFTEMRARGANVTDIAVLVVAADDGIMPQTEEAISHAKAANVPIVVALNKMDLPGANADRVLQQLSTLGLIPSEWSGDVEVVRCSALTGKGVDELLETLLVTADLHEYKANPDRDAMGTCLEAEQQAGRGVMAKIMVKNGTLEVGDIVVCGPAHGRVKAMYDTLKPNVLVKKAGPSTPVNITGLDIPPNAGDAFYVLKDIAQAREIAASRATSSREQSLSGISKKVSFDQFQRMLTDGRLGEKVEVSELNLIIRADVRGSIEAILKELGKFDHPEVKVKVLQAAVGAISVADVTLADASNAVVVGFNVIPDEAARALAEQRQVEIRRYDIIYKVTDDIKAMVEGKLKPEEKVVELGQALVKAVFAISRVGTVAGCYVSRGSIERNCRIRVFRDGRNIGDYALDSLRREKDDVKEVPRGMECGIRLAGFNDVKKDDILEAYKIEEVARTL